MKLGRMLHSESRSSNLSIQPYGKSHEAIFSVSRSTLNAIFLSKIESCENVKIEFLTKVLKVDKNINVTIIPGFGKKENAKSIQIQASLVIGADGSLFFFENF